MIHSPLRKPKTRSVLVASLFPVVLFLQLSPLFQYSLSATATAGSDEDAENVCLIQEPDLTESSGIAISRTHEQSLWIHNDSGDTAKLFLVGFNGRTRAVVSVRNINPIDWEDMCSFELDGEKWLLVGDIGDNGRVRGKSAPPCKLLLLKEPKLELEAETAAAPAQLIVNVVSVTEFSFPGGPTDCESLAVDTKHREILLLTKSDPLSCRLFRLPLTLTPGKHQAQAEIVAPLGVPWATAMDVSADGLQLVVVNMFSGAFITRNESENWSDACLRPVTVLTLPPRRQGESVCLEPDGRSLLLGSEGLNQPLWRVQLPMSEPP